MMNIVDYLVGNTDRHWGNWGFWIDNATNELQTLYPLMDFNKAFTAYDKIDGARCQTAPGNISQKEAALLAVQTIGLNQVTDIPEEWIEDEQDREMFFARLALLKKNEVIR